MILGLGNDIVDMRRLQTVWERHGNRFLNRIYTENEQSYSFGCAIPLHGFGRAYAAKEAAVKALGTGFTKGIGWRSVEIARRPKIRPTLVFHGAALARLQDLTPSGMCPRWQLSISDEPPYASAVAILFAVPDPLVSCRDA